MKRILSLSIISILISISSIASAAELQPSLGAQMNKQEQLNKKNTLSATLAERARLKKEAKDRALALQYQRLVRKNTNASTVVVSPQKPAIQVLTISRPPLIQPSPNTNTQTQNKIQIIPQPVNIPAPQNVDMTRLRTTWASWYNNVRQSEGLGTYSYDTRLDSTAYDWNIEFAKGLGQNHHTRTPGDGYYNFAKIDQWFIDRGINPKVINRSKHTENVGYGYYNCNSSDCTDALITSIRSTFDFFMSEKGKTYDAHYRSIVNPYFTKMGLSIIVDSSMRRYYLTVHYITE